MIKLSTANMSKGIETAKQFPPFVRFVAERQFKVVSRRSGNTYNVRFEKHGREKLAQCDCVAGQYNRQCYHVIACAAINVGIQGMRQAA